MTSIASPTAASLGRYGDIPVSLFTGKPTINIPMFKLEGRNLTIPLALNYHSSAVRVEEIAGWVGVGWSLDAGGVITRTVRGLPDDIPDGYLVNAGDSIETQLQDPSGFSEDYLSDVAQLHLDGEPDRYFFNFAGRSGEIFFARDENAEPYNYQPYSQPQQDIRFEVQSSSGQITAWTLTTEDGTRYTFGQTEGTTQNITVGGTSFTSSWYLTKVESANGNDTINLSYENDGNVTVGQRRVVAFNSLSGGSCTPPTSNSEFYSNTTSVYLREIETARQRAVFNRATRTDGGGKRLESIDIENKNTSETIRRYELEHGYFNAGGTELEQRLRLDGIRQLEGTVEPEEFSKWEFAYDTTHSLPGRGSNDLDYWGYYNGANNSGLAPKVTYNGTIYGTNNREPSESHLLTGILTEITYPTGGSTSFTYEGHRYGTSDDLGGGIRVQRIEHHDGTDIANNVILEYEYGNGILLVDPKMYHVHQFTRHTFEGR